LWIEAGAEGVDLEVQAGDLRPSEALVSAALASLFTDRRAEESDLENPDQDPRGYWAESPSDRWGSRLWLLERSKLSTDTLKLAEDYALEALAWMKVAGVASNIRATATRDASGLLALEIRITRDTRPRWESAWKGTDAEINSTDARGSLRLLFD